MRVAVRRIEGVETVEVSLNHGVAVIRLGPDNRVTLGQLRQAIRDNGFTPRAADVVVSGRLVRDSGRLRLAVPGQPGAYELASAPREPGGMAGLGDVPSERTLTIEGQIPEATQGDGRGTVLQVRRFSLQAASP